MILNFFGVGVVKQKTLIVANWSIVRVAGVGKYNDRMMEVNVVIGDVVWEVVSCYCPQAG